MSTQAFNWSDAQTSNAPPPAAGFKWSDEEESKPGAKTAAAPPPAPKPTLMSNLGLSEGPDVPLTDAPHATLSGIQSVGRGIRGAAQGLLHPIDSLKGIVSIPSQAAQVPAAIHDINASPDPLGTYAKVGQETAGQGAGQALVGAATEGIARPLIRATVTRPFMRGLKAGLG